MKAFIRKRMNPEKLGPDEAHRKSIFHRLSLFYAFTTWVGLGLAVYWLVKVRPKDMATLEDMKEKNILPHQEDLDKGGALWWVNALKTPDEMQDAKKVTVLKLKGMSYQGTEDITLKTKEIGQTRNRLINEKSDDFYLRRKYKIMPEEQGGPTNQEIRDQFKAEGKDYELELDWANNRAGRRTNYNPDGTVGSFMTTQDFESKMKPVKPDQRTETVQELNTEIES